MKVLLILLVLSFIPAGAQVEILGRQMALPNYPCMSCHSIFHNEKPKEQLKSPHDKLEFVHMEQITNCYSCHDSKDRNQLVLYSGEKVSFDESYKVCTQCHGEKFRDWSLGIHGRQVGKWNGEKVRYSCLNCHEAHHPKFPQWKADPRPKHPDEKKGRKLKGGH